MSTRDSDSIVQRVEDLLRSLPLVRVTRKGTIPYPELIPGIAREIVLRGGAAPSTGPSRVKLKQAAADARRWAKVLSKSYDKSRVSSAVAASGLRAEYELKTYACLLEQYLDARPKGQTGRKRDFRASRVAEYVAEEFHRLTGRSPGRSVSWEDGKDRGAFTILLKDIYKVLGISATAQHAARSAINKRKSRGNDNMAKIKNR